MKTETALARTAWLYLILVTAAFCLSQLQAAPFEENIDFTQPDGTRITLWGKGDEFSAVFETLDGYTVVFDPATQAYHYALLSADASQLLSSGAWVGRDTPPAVPRHQRRSAASVRQEAARRFAEWDKEMEVSQRWSALKAQSAALSGPISPKTPPSFTTLGNKLGLTLLIDFSDDPATIPQADLDGFCNADGYSLYGNSGSVKSYYYDVSNNKLTYSNVVTLYIRAPQPKTYYNVITNETAPQAQLLVNDALAALKALPNYATEILPTFDGLTVDTQNQVVACNVFFAGANSGVWSKGLWPLTASLSTAVELSPGGKKVKRIQISNIGSSPKIGGFCHENGHLLCGFPDIYDYDFDSSGGAGRFCLMNAGGSGGNPSQVCAYLKNAAGWATVTDLNTTSTQFCSLTAVAGTNFNHFYRLRKPGTTKEYFLLENRQKKGRDSGLPAAGIAIWHIDEQGQHDNQSLLTNSTHQNYEVTLEQADGLWDFENNRNNGDAKDLWYSGNSAANYLNVFSDLTLPGSFWWDGSLSGFWVEDFSASSDTMTFTVVPHRYAPVLLEEPVDLSASSGADILFRVVAFVTDPVSYQWRKDGTAIPAATNSIYSLASVSTTNAGGFSVLVTDPYGSITSRVATLTVSSDFSAGWIAYNDHYAGAKTHPNATAWNVWTNLNGAPGNSGPLTNINTGAILPVTLTITNKGADWNNVTPPVPAAGTPAYLYFYDYITFDGNLVRVAANDVVGYTFTGLNPACEYSFVATAFQSNASYTNRWTLCEITDALSWTDAHSSNVATQVQLTNLAPNQAIFNSGYNTPPSKGDVIAWDHIRPSFSGSCTFLCKRYAGILPDGSSSATGSGDYAYSFIALRLQELPTGAPVAINTQPQGQSVTEGSPALFQVQATGIPVYYQWRKNGLSLAGQTSAALTIAATRLNDTATYQVIVSNHINSVTSSNAALVVLPNTNSPPSITLQPRSQTVVAGDTATFTIIATGGAPLEYQWRFNGVNIIGASNNSYTLSAAFATNAGSYDVVVTNTWGSVTSAVATLTVLIGSNCVPPPAGLVAWWAGDGNANDIQGTNNGILMNGVTFVPGCVGQAFSFNGINQFVDMGNPASLQITGPLTLEAWFKTSSPMGNYKALASKWWSATSDAAYSLLWTTSGGLGFFLNSSASAELHTSSGQYCNDGLWHHVAGTWDGSAVRIYVDGAERGSATNASFGAIMNTTRPFRIGADTYSAQNDFPGAVDEVSVYNRALSSNEIAAIYAAGSAGKCRPPLPSLLTTPTRLANGALQFTFPNSSGTLFSVLATTNPALPFSNWTVLGGVTEISPGQFQFTDPQATNYPQRFYRVQSP